MLSERLTAWTQLFLADRNDEALLLTTSRPIFTDFIHSSDNPRLLMQFNSGNSAGSVESSGSDRQASLLADIENAAVQSYQVENQPNDAPMAPIDYHAHLTVYMIPDRSLRSCLMELAGVPCSDQIHPYAADGRADHVVIGLLNPFGLE
jgi:hypothetical protein